MASGWITSPRSPAPSKSGSKRRGEPAATTRRILIGLRTADVGPCALEHDAEKWVPVFGKRSCSTKRLERDDDSNKSHPALVPEPVSRGRQRTRRERLGAEQT